MKTDIFMNTSGTHFQFSSDDHKYPGKNFHPFNMNISITLKSFLEVDGNSRYEVSQNLNIWGISLFGFETKSLDLTSLGYRIEQRRIDILWIKLTFAHQV